eukprot:CAMPEP_0183354328 /NCGR_PEP_ID=MMETSP0164_2-20130417/37246_1 /TAXON_ID=221442 /ORGANISM="Coccolithus pelagicus ssp braarudi, Strain PLY182g" /LENGTH=93 /DNA_ID=CAMNT_0025527187 /DNA_START=303 /DNA_END=581 /DNA_ORIENTATION=+
MCTEAADSDAPLISRVEVHGDVGGEDAEDGALWPDMWRRVAHREEQLVRLGGAGADRGEGRVHHDRLDMAVGVAHPRPVHCTHGGGGAARGAE